jgi:SulP family sulfate permease
MPVGGSMSATALVRSAGARSRLANMIAGVTMALAILLFGRLVGMLAMPALAGLLIVVGFRTLKLDQVKMVWKTGLVQQVVMGITFVAALFVPLQFAVLIGVGMAVLLFVFQESNKITVMAWKIEPGRYPVESAPPAAVPAQRVTVLVPYGSLFYAAAPVFAEQLPEVTTESRHAVVIIVLRGRSEIGSTFVTVLQRYAETLRAHGSKLMLVGVDAAVLNQLASTRLLYTIGEANVFPATSQLGEALNSAVAAANAWLGQPPASAEIDAGQAPPEVSCAL